MNGSLMAFLSQFGHPSEGILDAVRTILIEQSHTGFELYGFGTFYERVGIDGLGFLCLCRGIVIVKQEKSTNGNDNGSDGSENDIEVLV